VRHVPSAQGVTVIAASCLLAAISLRARIAPRAPSPEAQNVRGPTDRDPGPRLTISIPPRWDPFGALPPLVVVSGQGGVSCTIRPYRDDGALDDDALATLATTLADVRDPSHPEIAPLDHRLVRVLTRTAWHFDAPTIRVVSAYRAPRRRAEGLHAKGRALDFALDGVAPRDVGAYLREQPRLGVGVYVHRRTQYVHLDVRDESYHWIDASPPRTSGWPASLRTVGLAALDASWTEDSDLPERAH
jgi:hypothetical protein